MLRARIAIAVNHRSCWCVMVYVSIERLARTVEGTPVAPARERSEAELVERARAGDHDAFSELLDARLNRTFRTAMAILGDEAEARDVTQAIFVQAWTRLPQLRDATLCPSARSSMEQVPRAQALSPRPLPAGAPEHRLHGRMRSTASGLKVSDDGDTTRRS